ncbi:helix-turn-helix domain-containing protein [Sedimentitalea todarodis]|uniref:Helix-turn-helix domain-containing protein n=1 Tax=Sedimentitalea todarodis TaxID=1631240 RepID=A0ABU3VD07_9RHOB|nr:helix-turn-helix domain-containing protein [Sedimentitalea todarodis]MDU9004052.1 helix-turn-helix domain-containing protein [Sedimentitalea todarodis]
MTSQKHSTRRLLSVNDAAHYLGMSRSWLYVQIKFGHIKVKKVGSATRIEISELDNFADDIAA